MVIKSANRKKKSSSNNSESKLVDDKLCAEKCKGIENKSVQGVIKKG